jgi:WD40 repeat protein
MDVKNGRIELLQRVPDRDELEQEEANPSEDQKRQLNDLFKVHTSEIKRVSFHPASEDEISTAGDDGILCIWRRRQDGKWEVPYRFDTGGAIQALRYNRSGDRVGIATITGVVRIYWFNDKRLVEIAKTRQNIK